MTFFRNPFSTPSIPVATKLPQHNQQLEQAEYDVFASMIYQYSRIQLGPNKKEMVASRLLRRLRACNVNSFKEYLAFISSPKGKEELTHFVDAISTNHTFFFREMAHFDFLKDKLLPPLLADKTREGNKHFRIWSAAASSGEESYSIAILLSEYFQKHPEWNWSIEATDISTRILEQARKGEYERIRLGSMPQAQITQYFQKTKGSGGDCFQVSPLIKARVNFKQLNLLAPAYPFSQTFDLIFCRNVMIYFDTPTKQELINKLISQLRVGGYLFTGHSESLTGLQHPLKMAQVSVFQRVN